MRDEFDMSGEERMATGEAEDSHEKSEDDVSSLRVNVERQSKWVDPEPGLGEDTPTTDGTLSPAAEHPRMLSLDENAPHVIDSASPQRAESSSGESLSDIKVLGR